jgi:aminomethyltransferase
MPAKTPLYESHVASNGKIVDFSGWQLPVHYGSLIDEHHAVRQRAGVFDVSHMTIVDVVGNGSGEFLSVLLANNPATLDVPGAALYSCMLSQQGGVIDDLIAYWMGDDRYRLIVNAATREKDLQWINQQATPFDVQLTERPELAMLAVQGPEAIAFSLAQMPADVGQAAANLERFQACQVGDWFVARTGYTGEDGFEIALEPADALTLWRELLAAGVAPCGLGARDTLRLEAGMNLYGHDMDESHTPLTSGLGWTVGWEPPQRRFIGREALEAQRGEVTENLVGLVLDGKGVLREGQKILDGEREVGTVTSGTFSPTLQKSIAFARLSKDSGDGLEVQIRTRRVPVTRTARVFVRNGKAVLPAS